MTDEQKMTTCDFCKKEFPMSELNWVRNTSTLSCTGCMPAAIQDFEDFCKEMDEQDDY